MMTTPELAGAREAAVGARRAGGRRGRGRERESERECVFCLKRPVEKDPVGKKSTTGKLFYVFNIVLCYVVIRIESSFEKERFE